MKLNQLIVSALFAVPALLSTNAIAAQDKNSAITKMHYACEGKQVLEVVYVNTDKDSYAIISQVDEMIPMKITRSASGAIYEAMDKNYTYKLYTKGNTATLVESKDKPVLSQCVAG